MPVISPSLKAGEGDLLSRLFRSGTKANHAKNDSFPGGKEAVNITPERTASNMPRPESGIRFSFVFSMLYLPEAFMVSRYIGPDLHSRHAMNDCQNDDPAPILSGEGVNPVRLFLLRRKRVGDCG